MGPNIGPTMTPTPQIAIAEPCFSGGLISNKTTWDNGTRAAPNTPCRSRAATISSSEFDIPQSTEASVKPLMDAKNMFLCPKRSTNQPVSGVAMAAATIYAVNTQAI